MDRETKLVHHIRTTSANEHDVTVVHELLNGEEKTVHGDSGYINTEKHSEAVRKNKDKKKEHQKSTIRCKSEHIFTIVKKLFNYQKIRYRGL